MNSTKVPDIPVIYGVIDTNQERASGCPKSNGERVVITEYRETDVPPVIYAGARETLDPSLPEQPQKVKIVSESHGKFGLGVVATEDIQQNQFLGLVYGEIICHSRMKLRNNLDFTWDMIWELDNGMKYKYYLDTSAFVGILGYANHSCDPNAKYFLMAYNNKPVIAAYAKKKITSGRYVHFDHYSVVKRDRDIFPEGCMCGSAKCRYPKK